MDNDNLFDPINRMVEFGMGLAIAQQMVKSMNLTNDTVKIPGSFQDYRAKYLSRVCRQCGNMNPVEARFCGKCGEKLIIESPQTKSCLQCNTVNEINAKFCISCGTPFEQNLCSSCKTENPIDAKFCKNCGEKLLSFEKESSK